MYRHFNITAETTTADVQKQYRKLSMQYHPDREGGSTEKFREVSDEYKRALRQVGRKEQANAGNSLYNLINDNFVDIDKLIGKLEVPQQVKPAIGHLARFGLSELEKAINKKFGEQKKQKG